MRQRRWLELLVDYDLEINYHPGKANVVADALSRKTHATLACHLTTQKEILKDLDEMGIEVRMYQHNATLAYMEIQPTLISKIKEAQQGDAQTEAILKTIRKGKVTEFKIKEDGVLWYRDRLCVPNNKEIKKELMSEAHTTPYTSHPGSTKMYHNLKTTLWWSDMKREIAQFVSQCMTCQQVKIEHQRLGGPLQTMEVPRGK